MTQPLIRLNRGSYTKTATIANSATTSGAVDCSGASFGGFITPAALTGTTMTFTVSSDESGTYVPLRDSSGAAISITVATSGGYALPPELFAFPWFKFVSGSSEAASRSIIVTLKG
jgi:hypothetical protein